MPSRRPLLALAVIAASIAAASTAAAEEPEPPSKQDEADTPIDVSVEGAKAPRGARDPDVASYVARGEPLRRPGATAVDVIAASPGVQAARTGAGSDLATVSIRGAPSAQLPVYLAGVRLNDDVTGGADLSTVPLFALDRAEVYRGNAPADADRLGIGGAVFFEPRLPRGTRLGGSFGAGSFGELAFGAFGATGDDRAGALFSFSRQSATNDFTFVDDRRTVGSSDDVVRTRENGDATTHDAWAIGRLSLSGGGRLVLIANAFAREQGVVGTTSQPAREARSATQRELVAASARLPCAPARAGEGAPEVTDAAIDRCSIEVGSSLVLARRTVSDPAGELGLGGPLTSLHGDRWQQSARLRARLTDRLEARASLFAGIDRLGIDLAPGARLRASRLSVTGSASVAWDVHDRVTLFALGAGECLTTLAASGLTAFDAALGFGSGDVGRACAAGGPAGRAGVRFVTPPGIILTASGGSYLRVPTLGELYGLSGAVLGNPSLVPERGYTAELGARWGRAMPSLSAQWYVDVTGFARLAENLIAYRQSRIDQIKPFNVTTARLLGVEALLGLDLLQHVRAQVSLSALDPRDVSPGAFAQSDLLPYSAQLALASRAEVYTNLEASVRFIDRVAIAASFSYRSGRVADPAGTFHLAEIRDLGLDASATFLGGRAAARFSVTNLLDVANQDMLGFALPGRAFHGSLEASFW